MFYVIAVGGVIVSIQTWLFWRLSRQLREASRLGPRITALSEAMTLLTETTESGFAAMAGELDRRASRRRARSTAKSSDALTPRVVAASRRGTSIPEIAAAERVSEGEVRLRLTLAEEASV